MAEGTIPNSVWLAPSGLMQEADAVMIEYASVEHWPHYVRVEPCPEKSTRININDPKLNEAFEGRSIGEIFVDGDLWKRVKPCPDLPYPDFVKEGGHHVCNRCSKGWVIA